MMPCRCVLFISPRQDPVTWNFLKQNFAVNKMTVAFSAIGADHAIEHENRAVKVLGGIKGIANKVWTSISLLYQR